MKYVGECGFWQFVQWLRFRSGCLRSARSGLTSLAAVGCWGHFNGCWLARSFRSLSRSACPGPIVARRPPIQPRPVPQAIFIADIGANEFAVPIGGLKGRVALEFADDDSVFPRLEHSHRAAIAEGGVTPCFVA